MQTSLFLLLVPFLTVISGLYVYRFNGKKQFLMLDIVQFFYCFVLAPLFFAWAKTFFFFLLRSELDLRLSVNEIFFIDTLFSIFFLYIFAFIVLHSLTKTFNLRLAHDPLYDIFHHSEYFHLWLSHLIMFAGGLSIIALFGLANVFLPLQFPIVKGVFYIIAGSGVLGGILTFFGIWLSDPQQARNFMRVMKLLFGVFFMLHVGAYFWLDVPFSPSYAMYWWSMFMFSTLIVIGLFSSRSARTKKLLEKISTGFKHKEWDFRLQLFPQNKVK